MASAASVSPDLAAFEGRWTVSRRISDQRNDEEGQLSGVATFREDGPDRLLYEESGTLIYAKQPPMTATRHYIWQTADQGIEVLFEDGRAFHVIEHGRSMPDAEHLCQPDFYHVSYDFTRWPDWSTTWRVVGPRKDYRMVSHYARIG